MFSLTNPSAGTRDPRTNTSEASAAGRWDNEGGATPAAAPAAAAVAEDRTFAPAPVDLASSALDNRQDELMAVTSSDGRPPTHGQRIFEWRWLGAGAILLSVGITAWVAIKGVSLFAILAGLGMAVLLLVGASPVLAAGLMRGKEERIARRNARIERRGRRDR